MPPPASPFLRVPWQPIPFFLMPDLVAYLPQLVTALLSGGVVGVVVKYFGDVQIKRIEAKNTLQIKEIEATLTQSAQKIDGNDKLTTHLMEEITLLSGQLETARKETSGFQKIWMEAEQQHIQQERECNEKIAQLREKHHEALSALEEKIEAKGALAIQQLQSKITGMEEGFRQERVVHSQIEAELRSMTEVKNSLQEVNNNLIKRNDELKKEVDGLKKGRRKEDVN